MAGRTLAADAERRSKAPFRAAFVSGPDARFAVIVDLAIRPTLYDAVCTFLSSCTKPATELLLIGLLGSSHSPGPMLSGILMFRVDGLRSPCRKNVANEVVPNLATKCATHSGT